MVDIVSGKRHFNRVVTGFLFHLVGQVLRAAFSNDIFVLIFGSIGWYYIFSGLYRLRSELRNPFKGGYRFLFYSYLWICLIMIIRGYLIDYPFQWLGLPSLINYHFFEPTYILCYLMPFVAYIPTRYYTFEKMARFAFWGYIVYSVIVVVFYPQLSRASAMAAVEGRMDSEIPILAIAALCINFFLLCWKYLSPKKNRVIIVGYVFSLLVIVLFARRGGLAISLIILLIYLWTRLEKIKSTVMKMPIMVMFVALFAFLVYLSDSNPIFVYLNARGTTDTRSSVQETLLSQMDDWQMFFGKGLNGRYYCPLNIESDDAFGGWRYGIETGFYNLVLKGGYLMAFTYILLLLIPSFKGMFKSNNLFCKVGGAYVFLSVVELYPFGWLTFNVKFLIIWMCIVICMSPKIRRMKDNDIYHTLFTKV